MEFVFYVFFLLLGVLSFSCKGDVIPEQGSFVLFPKADIRYLLFWGGTLVASPPGVWLWITFPLTERITGI